MHSGPTTQPPSAAGITSVIRFGNAEVRNTSVYRADNHASTEVRVG